jgi:hypothetical protein
MAVAIIDKKAHPSAAPWYKAAPVEPVGNKSTIKVDNVVEIENLTIEKILDKLIELKSPDEVVIVAHGSSEGLAIPLMHGASAGAEKASIRAIAQDHETEEDDGLGGRYKLPAMSVKRAASITTLSEANVTALRQKMSKVRARKLKHVAFRSCDMGASRETMGLFRMLFGAASVSAPDVYDSYGHFNPGNPEPKLAAWVKAQKNNNFYVIVEDKVAFGIRWGRGISYQIVFAGETADAIKAWVKKHIRDDYSSGGVVYHGQAVTPGGPNAPGILFVRDAAFIGHIIYLAK